MHIVIEVLWRSGEKPRRPSNNAICRHGDLHKSVFVFRNIVFTQSRHVARQAVLSHHRESR